MNVVPIVICTPLFTQMGFISYIISKTISKHYLPTTLQTIPTNKLRGIRNEHWHQESHSDTNHWHLLLSVSGDQPHFTPCHIDTRKFISHHFEALHECA
jgi:hypothetical protein